MKTVELICPICEVKYEKPKTEWKRNIKLSRPCYCSLKCAGKANLSNIPEEKRKHPENLVQGVRRDELSPFRYFMKCMKNRSNHRIGKACKVTLLDLREQWEKQNGICPYTGWQLLIPKSTTAREQVPHIPERASVDRIDSSKPYEVGNIQFVATIAQYAKHAWHEKELIKFCQAVANNVE